jgi:hypothetical protein
MHGWITSKKRRLFKKINSSKVLRGLLFSLILYRNNDIKKLGGSDMIPLDVFTEDQAKLLSRVFRTLKRYDHIEEAEIVGGLFPWAKPKDPELLNLIITSRLLQDGIEVHVHSNIRVDKNLAPKLINPIGKIVKQLFPKKKSSFFIGHWRFPFSEKPKGHLPEVFQFKLQLVPKIVLVGPIIERVMYDQITHDRALEGL